MNKKKSLGLIISYILAGIVSLSGIFSASLWSNEFIAWSMAFALSLLGGMSHYNYLYYHVSYNRVSKSKSKVKQFLNRDGKEVEYIK